jgi:hypothetical protein
MVFLGTKQQRCQFPFEHINYMNNNRMRYGRIPPFGVYAISGAKSFRTWRGKNFHDIGKKPGSVRLFTNSKCMEVKKVKHRLDKSGRIL